MDPTVLAAIIGGLITGVPSVIAVWWSNKKSSDLAKVVNAHTLSESVRLQLAAIRAQLHQQDAALALDALDELFALGHRLSRPEYRDQDRLAALALANSRLVERVKQYSETSGVEIQVQPEAEEATDD